MQQKLCPDFLVLHKKVIKNKPDNTEVCRKKNVKILFLYTYEQHLLHNPMGLAEQPLEIRLTFMIDF